MYEEEDRAFIDAVNSGERSRSHIDAVLESAKLLDALYASADKHEELTF
jgi:hypothetical protein